MSRYAHLVEQAEEVPLERRAIDREEGYLLDEFVRGLAAYMQWPDDKWTLRESKRAVARDGKSMAVGIVEFNLPTQRFELHVHVVKALGGYDVSCCRASGIISEIGAAPKLYEQIFANMRAIIRKSVEPRVKNRDYGMVEEHAPYTHQDLSTGK